MSWWSKPWAWKLWHRFSFFSLMILPCNRKSASANKATKTQGTSKNHDESWNSEGKEWQSMGVELHAARIRTQLNLWFNRFQWWKVIGHYPCKSQTLEHRFDRRARYSHNVELACLASLDDWKSDPKRNDRNDSVEKMMSSHEFSWIRMFRFRGCFHTILGHSQAPFVFKRG